MAAVAKKARTQALSNFTRAVNTFYKLIDESAPSILVTPQYEKLSNLYDKLEAAQDDFITKTDIDIDNDVNGIKFLDEPSERQADVMKCYSTYLKGEREIESVEMRRMEAEKRKLEEDKIKMEARERKLAEEVLKEEEINVRFESAKVELVSMIDRFMGMNIGIQDTLVDASVIDKRNEWKKIEADFKILKEKLITLATINPSKDLKDMNDKFKAEVENLFTGTQKWILPKLKDSTDSTSGGTSTSITTRRETVNLPKFEGDEVSSPYLKFPTWKTRWDTLISDYDKKFWAGLLYDHLDEVARSKFIGWESNYDKMIERLQNFYGDRLKIVRCVVKEVMSQPVIEEGEYKSLISYSVILENNYNRLLNLENGLEHEMSNSSAMSMILQRFPRPVCEKWAEHLIAQDDDVKLKPFGEFIEWLSSQKEIWEKMVSNEISSTSTSSDPVTSFYGYGTEEKRRCRGCKKIGHIQRNCPDDKDKGGRKARGPPKVKKFWCALHLDEPGRKCFSNSCQELRRLDPKQRVKLMRDNGDCLHCCCDHKSDDCRSADRVCGGGKEGRGCSKKHKMHELFCPEAKVFSIQHVHSTNSKSSDKVVLLIMSVPTLKRKISASVFWDSGCTSNFIREDFAKRCGFHGEEETLSVTTLGGVVTDFKTVISYKCYLRDENGYLHNFDAYGMKSITGDISKIGKNKLKQLFPQTPDKLLKCLERGDTVDILIGLGHSSWHPERCDKAKGDGDLWIYRGIFGACVGGRHPDIDEKTCRSDDLFYVNCHIYHAYTSPSKVDSVHDLEFCPRRIQNFAPVEDHQKDVEEQMNVDDNVTDEIALFPGDVTSNSEDTSLTSVIVSFPQKSVCSYEWNVRADVFVPLPAKVVKFSDEICNAALTSPFRDEELFFKADSLGTVVEPRCGGCKCSRCPVPGSNYSFQEQKEYDIISNNLFRKEGENRWYTSYPWRSSRDALPKNDVNASKSLLSLEKMLKRDPEKSVEFCRQIDEMVERGAAICLTDEEVKAWDGAYYYLPMVLVKGKKRFRVCFDASRNQCGYPSLNSNLYKGPDRFLNNISAVILGFRNGRVAAVADLSKFHNQVYLVEEDTHMQRFLWRSMDTEISPQTYVVSVNNFGVLSANCIATSALYKSADHFAPVYPVESKEIKVQTYIDDELIAARTMSELLIKTSRMDEICEHAGMKNKGWTYSGDTTVSEFSIGDEAGDASEKVLGLSWTPSTDVFNFNVVLRFKVNSKDIEVTSLTHFDDIKNDLVLTRRMLASNLARIFDPIGFLCPVLLQSKLLMREMWSDKGIGWDDPVNIAEKWLVFLSSLLTLVNLKFPRSLWPDAEVDGLPMLIIFSDGAALAFGTVAYIRWKLKDGGYWTRIIMAKCKIAPKNIVSIPRMELNGAVLGNRVKNFILKELNIEFSKVYQLVDSSTVLGYAQKEYGAFKPYEGIRVAEIQSSNEFVDGKLKGWAWVASADNAADWCTKSRRVEDLHGSFWESGPEFLRKEESSWPIKLSYKKDDFEGMVGIPKPVHFVQIQILSEDYLSRLVVRGSSWKKIIRVLVWMYRVALSVVTSKPDLLKDVPSCYEFAHSKLLLLKYAQKDSILELQDGSNGKGRYRKLAPLLGDDGLWRVGSRMKNFVPFTIDGDLPVIIPYDHRITSLIMRESHQFNHAGQDSTLSRFRSQGFWTTRGGHLAKKVRSDCIPCRKVDGKPLQQPMGDFPLELMKDSYAWSYCQLDLFGPFSCRGDVNPRTTKKTWGMLIEDVNSGGVYIDIVQDYSTPAVLLTLRRFGSIRGWPGVISTDPGSQLESASGILERWWKTMEHSLREFSTSKNFEWKISPPDSPWRQGKAERRIGIVKKLIHHSVGDSRLTPVELQTTFFEIANICNERPLGLSKPREDGSYVLITPNQLLMGRSLNLLPDDTGISESLPMTARYRLVKHVTDVFWQRWSTYVSPALIVRQKWHVKSRNLCVGDLVMICEQSKVKSKYKLAIVEVVKRSGDDIVRVATLRYCNIEHNPRGDDKVTTVRVDRSVQRLVLIMPVEEMSQSVVVKENEHSVQCTV